MTVPVPPAGEHAAYDKTFDPYAVSRRPRGLLIAVVVGMALAAVLALIPLPYAILRPGPAINTLGKDSGGTPLIEVTGAKTYPAAGALDFTTVSVQGGPGRRVNVWDLVGAAISPSEDIYDEDAFFPKGITEKEVKDENTAEMASSQEMAVAVALRSIGQKVTPRYRIGDFAPEAPSAKVLKTGDILLAIDKVDITSLSVLRERVRAHQPGDKVTLRIERDGKPSEVTVTTMDAGSQAALGVILATTYNFPYQVTIHAGDVGGPSAGLMFTLAVNDVLTPGDLTGGKRIAGTGTIDDSGQVGPIGGIRQKVVGAKKAGATIFLTPADNCAELKGRTPEGIRAIRVATFAEALAEVKALSSGATGSLPTCN